MMGRRGLHLLCWGIFFPVSTLMATGDSLRYLTPQDTIFLQTGAYNQKIFRHEIERKQTLFSLAKFYGLSVEELYLYNPGLKDRVVQVGDPISIPIPNRAIIRYLSPQRNRGPYVPVYYVVKKGDTMYRIAKHFFRMPMDTLMARAGMQTYDLSVGQRLHVGWMSMNGIPESYRQFKGGPLARRNHAMRQVFLRESKGRRLRNAQGAAYWEKDSDEDSDLYALHRKAKINSVIEVRNPMNNRNVYVKVIGRIPDTNFRDEVVVVLSPLSAKLLGAVDPRFFVRVKYFR